jgi:SAM-dependent methyltransferase
MRELYCTTCGEKDYVLRYKARLPKPEELDFSARRPGRRYHPRIVECRGCGQIYSNPFYADQLIIDLYRRAKYIDEPQLRNMCDDYIHEFEVALKDLQRYDIRILEVGCATGFFLDALYRKGYRHLQGIEPGEEAVRRAPEQIRPVIRSDFFSDDSYPTGSFDLVCCFQVMDHMPDPAMFMRAVYNVLADGGRFLTINHDIRAPITRLLGEHSPMYDIEHIYLFDRSTICKLFVKSGFDVSYCRPLRNSYTVDYALKMLPLPSLFKGLIQSITSAVGLGSVAVRVPGGNMVTLGKKRTVN